MALNYLFALRVYVCVCVHQWLCDGSVSLNFDCTPAWWGHDQSADVQLALIVCDGVQVSVFVHLQEI